jgi:hypothetical protein
MTSLKQHILYSFLLLFAVSSPAAADDYTYVWTPRSVDVGTTNSKDYVLLEALLKLCEPVAYKIVPGSSLDSIIRAQLLVSQQYAHAYHLYIKRIQELNPNLTDVNMLKVGNAIYLPSGPKYGGTELADEMLTDVIRESTFASMSKSAYELGVVTRDKIKTFATRSLHAYVTSSGKGDTESSFQAIENRGLVYPIDSTSHPGDQLMQVQIFHISAVDASSKAAVAVIYQSDPDNLLPGLFPVSDSQPATCTQPCTSCAANFQLPPGTDLSRARVLVEDTGIAPGLVDSRHLLLQQLGDDGKDLSPQSHGTFVYSQIAAPSNTAEINLFGLIPKSNVYVTKAVQDVGASQYFMMSEIINGWKLFSAQMNNDPSAAATRIVNISAFGEPVFDPDHPPSIPNDGHLLLVAAAGNDKKEDEPALQAFPRLSNGTTPLLIAGALGTDGKPAPYTNWNSTYVHLFAPGDCVCGAPGQINGTSQAAPFVSTAAAVLASARPNWNPRFIMWRLISTADHPIALRGKAFGGSLNLRRALDPSILVEEATTEGNGPKVHHASSIIYDANWKGAFARVGINKLDKETLRLYEPSSANGQTCFISLQNLYFILTPLCVDSRSKIQLIDGGASVELTAGQIADIILPMPKPGDDGATLPDVSVQTY